MSEAGGARRPPLPSRLRPLLGAQFVSSVGSAMLLLGVTYTAFATTGSAFRTVLVTTCYILPSVALGLVAGRMADRHDPARVVIVDDVIKCVLYLTLAATNMAGLVNANTLLVFALINGSVSAFTFPAWQAYVHGLVEEDELSHLNAVLTSVVSVGSLVGAVAGGFLINRFGATPAFVIDALSFPVLALAVARTPSHPKPRTGPRPSTAPRQLLRDLWANPVLRQAMVRLSVLSFLVAPVSQLLPAIADRLRPGPHILGILTAVAGAGAALVAWRLVRLHQHHDDGSVQVRPFVLGSVFLLLIGVSGELLQVPWLWVTVVASLFSLGLLLGLAQSVLTAVIQVNADPRQEGVILAVMAALAAVCAALGGLVFGALSDVVSVFLALAVAGALLTVHAVALALRRRLTPDGAEIRG